MTVAVKSFNFVLVVVPNDKPTQQFVCPHLKTQRSQRWFNVGLFFYFFVENISGFDLRPVLYLHLFCVVVQTI